MVVGRERGREREREKRAYLVERSGGGKKGGSTSFDSIEVKPQYHNFG